MKPRQVASSFASLCTYQNVIVHYKTQDWTFHLSLNVCPVTPIATQQGHVKLNKQTSLRFSKHALAQTSWQMGPISWVSLIQRLTNIVHFTLPHICMLCPLWHQDGIRQVIIVVPWWRKCTDKYIMPTFKWSIIVVLTTSLMYWYSGHLLHF